MELWNTDTYLYHYQDNLGHNPVIGIISEIPNIGTIIKLPEFLKLYKLNICFPGIEYNPFKGVSEQGDNKYAILALFLSSKIIYSILNENDPTKKLDMLLCGEFCTKYIKTIMAYIAITTIERPEFRFRMYLDYFSYTFLNRFTINNKIFADIFLTPTNYIFLNIDANNNKSTQLHEALNKAKENIKNLQEAQYNLCTLMITAFTSIFIGSFNPKERLNKIEFILYNLSVLDNRKYVNEYNFGNEKTYVHSDGGFIGSVVRTFPLRQCNFMFYGSEKKRPSFIMLRDAHNCPSASDFDTFIYDDIKNCKKQYDWVHNIYYNVWWHSRTNTDLGTHGFTRGPIFYYINAREKEPTDMVLMSDSDWGKTFGRLFIINVKRDNQIGYVNDGQIFDENYTKTNYPDIRSQGGIYYRPADVPENRYKLGVNYGIDEFISTFCVYDKDNKAVDKKTDSIYTNSRWNQMYFGFDAYLFQGFNINNESIIFGILASCYIQKYRAKIFDESEPIYYKTILEFIQTLRYYKAFFMKKLGYNISVNIEDTQFSLYNDSIYREISEKYSNPEINNFLIKQLLTNDIITGEKIDRKIYFIEFDLIDYYPNLEQILNIISWARDQQTSLYNTITIADIITYGVNSFGYINGITNTPNLSINPYIRNSLETYYNGLRNLKPSAINEILYEKNPADKLIPLYFKGDPIKGGSSKRKKGGFSQQGFNIKDEIDKKLKDLRNRNLPSKGSLVHTNKINSAQILSYSDGKGTYNITSLSTPEEPYKFSKNDKNTTPTLSKRVLSRTFLKQHSVFSKSILIIVDNKQMEDEMKTAFSVFLKEYNNNIDANYEKYYGSGNGSLSKEQLYINPNSPKLHTTLAARFLSTVPFIKEMDADIEDPISSKYETSMSQLYISKIISTVFPYTDAMNHPDKPPKTVTLDELIQAIEQLQTVPFEETKIGGHRKTKTKQKNIKLNRLKGLTNQPG